MTYCILAINLLISLVLHIILIQSIYYFLNYDPTFQCLEQIHLLTYSICGFISSFIIHLNQLLLFNLQNQGNHIKQNHYEDAHFPDVAEEALLR